MAGTILYKCACYFQPVFYSVYWYLDTSPAESIELDVFTYYCAPPEKKDHVLGKRLSKTNTPKQHYCTFGHAPFPAPAPFLAQHPRPWATSLSGSFPAAPSPATQNYLLFPAHILSLLHDLVMPSPPQLTGNSRPLSHVITSSRVPSQNSLCLTHTHTRNDFRSSPESRDDLFGFSHSSYSTCKHFQTATSLD